MRLGDIKALMPGSKLGSGRRKYAATHQCAAFDDLPGLRAVLVPRQRSGITVKALDRVRVGEARVARTLLAAI